MDEKPVKPVRSNPYTQFVNPAPSPVPPALPTTDHNWHKGEVCNLVSRNHYQISTQAVSSLLSKPGDFTYIVDNV